MNDQRPTADQLRELGGPLIIDRDYRTGYIISIKGEPSAFQFVATFRDAPDREVEQTMTLLGARYAIRRDIRRRRKIERFNRKYAGRAA